MAKVSANEITSLSEDWGLDKRNGLPYSGEAVQKFIKSQLSEVLAGLKGKFGDAIYEGGQIKFYDELGGTVIGALTITGTSYIVSVDSNVNSSFTVLTSDSSFIIRLTPSTESMEFGSTSREEFPEDYTFKFEVDSGNGFVDRTPASNTVKQGASAEIDIRNYLTTGINRIRVVMTGVESGQPKTVVYTALLTSLSLSCDHKWHTVWFEGETYAITNIFFSGNIAKTLHVKIGDRDPLTTTYAASVQYVSVPTTFDLTNAIPDSTGVIPIEIWMTGEGVETKHIRYNIMYVAKADVGWASLICVNNVPDKVYNFSQETLLQYAVYNVGSINQSVKAYYEGKEVELFSSKVDVVAQTKYDFDLSLQIDTLLNSGVSIDVILSSEEVTVIQPIDVDNSNAYIPTVGAKFYLNTSLGSNATAERKSIINSAVVEDKDAEYYKPIYSATWEGYTFADDAWSADAEGHRALVTKAGSNIIVPDLKPFIRSNSLSTTLEFMVRASNIADYDTPIISCMDTEDYSTATTGLVVFPTKIVLLSSSKKNVVFQQLPLSENRIHHIAVVIQRAFAGDATKNLARIYIDGNENVTFSFDGLDTFYKASGVNSLRIGQASTDTYLYMMRIYDKALESSDVFANYLNALIETAETSRLGLRDDNNILEAGVPNYYLCQKAGFNAFVIETDKTLPSLDNPVEYIQVETSEGSGVYTTGINIHLEYNDHPEWNVSAYDVPLDGQGTTSKKYKVWNLRSNIKKAVLWRYHNLRDADGKVLEVISKDGYLMGHGLNAPVSKATWKKNIASQPQGHKMGATGLYNDLFKKVMGGSAKLVADKVLPTEQSRVATKQLPFVGWQKRSDGSYTFLGMFTGGPDKTDKKTFGYNAVEEFPSLMMIEGPNHDPYMTRFLVPWIDVFYDSENETLSIGAESATEGNKQEGWDADIVADYSTDKASDAGAILKLYEDEFKPAYDPIFYNSPYLASLSEVGYSSVGALNNDLTNFRKGQVTLSYEEGEGDTKSVVEYPVPNGLLTLYDTDYNLIYFRYKTGKYELLPKSTHNMLTYLGVEGTPTTRELITARMRKWLVEVPKYVNMAEAYFRQDFDEFLGVSDNDAKNSYWRKFLALALGGKWGFNEDDLDTLFQNDNNGQDTKEYFIEPNDTNNGNDIFQGRTSAFWFAVRLWCKDKLRGMMVDIIKAFGELAQELNVKETTVKGQVLAVIAYYFWEHSSKYFPAAVYNADTVKNYINVWFEDPSAVYNNVPPLTQIHGDHHETELEWVEKRIPYMFSKYQVGAFEAGSPDGYGSLDFTPLEEFTMRVKPAIWLYPRISVGGAQTLPSVRTPAGEECALVLPASGTTGVYIKGLDWLSDLGDLSKLILTSRGGSDIISFTVSGKRLRRVKLGDASDEVLFNAVSVGIKGESIEEVDVQNVVSMQGTLDLTGCPRLRKAYLGGTSLQHIYPPVGGRVRELSLPETTATLFLHSLNLLEADKLIVPNLANISTLYVNNCENFDPLEMLKTVYNTDGNKLDMIGIVWTGVKEDNDKSTMIMLGDIARKTGVDGGYRGAVYEGGAVTPQTIPNIAGTLRINYSVYKRDIEDIENSRIPLNILYDPSNLYVWFEDETVRSIVATNWGDGTGITEAQAAAVTNIGTVFKGNEEITKFDEFEKFEMIAYLNNANFQGCNKLEKIVLPDTFTEFRIGGANNEGVFKDCTSLMSINLDNIISMGGNVFYNTPNLVMDVIMPSLKTFDLSFKTSQVRVFGSSGITKFVAEKLETISGYFSESASIPYETSSFGMFANCKNLKYVDLGGKITSLPSSTFANCEALEEVRGLESITTLGSNNFYGCRSLKTIYLPNCTSIHMSASAYNRAAFMDSGIETIYAPKVTSLLAGDSSYSAFRNCTSLTTVEMNLQTIAAYSFYGCIALKSIDLSKVVTLGQNAFYGCTSLEIEDLQLPNLETLGRNAFYGVKIKKVSDLGKITSIPSGNLENSLGINEDYLESFTLPDTITKIPDKLLFLCKNVSEFNANWENITSVGQSAFLGCSSLVIEELSMPSLTTLGYTVFSGVKIGRITDLGNITTTPNGYYSNFLSCDAEYLKSVVFPGTITSLNDDVLGNNTNMEYIIIKATTPPTLGRRPFASDYPIYVPNASVEAYKTATNWSTYASRIFPISQLETDNPELYAEIEEYL